MARRILLFSKRSYYSIAIESASKARNSTRLRNGFLKGNLERLSSKNLVRPEDVIKFNEKI
jgi:hypothetical protein